MPRVNVFIPPLPRLSPFFLGQSKCGDALILFLGFRNFFFKVLHFTQIPQLDSHFINYIIKPGKENRKFIGCLLKTQTV